MSTVPTAAEGLKCSLAAGLLRGFGELRLQVAGASMLPALWPGDILTFRRCMLRDAVPGDIVLFLREGRLFAHRVLEAGPATLLTRGDALPAPDPPVAASELLGRLARIERRGREFAPQPRSRFDRCLSWAERRWDWPARWLLRLGWLRQRLRCAPTAAADLPTVLEQM